MSVQVIWFTLQWQIVQGIIYEPLTTSDPFPVNRYYGVRMEYEVSTEYFVLVLPLHISNSRDKIELIGP